MSDSSDDKLQSDESDENTSDKKEAYDPTLDVCSDKFDPVKALSFTGRINLPYSKVPRFNTLKRLGSEHELLNVDIIEREQQRKKEMTAIISGVGGTASSSQAGRDGGEPSNIHEANKRRFLPHQEPIKGFKKTVNYRNILTRMVDVEGPLKLLKNCLEERKKVKIITRHGYGIRGYCTAYVEAFDKHFNMALADVTEVWTRKKSRKNPALGNIENQQSMPRKVITPKVKIIKSDKKTETCQRNIPKLMMRGEHVVLIISQETTAKQP
ncbi:U7 snRNA-associated Sm-like protein LSm11 [Chrysoperla carnea]|uniref:U7 snRNA-associated Sm-like protein LSm11 n=1 Tax=Chrysoperla carnea TaxID=189513 RepID=UPI001D095F25|nr:U7 snRNA-associated Sm-like protein LSm11 [Chrysoperla carnea]